MPTYDYKCQKCGHQLEYFQSMKDEPLKTCPECNTDNLKRMIGAGAGLIFKGSGFYLTDYKNNNSSKPSTGSTAKSDTKTETKPEAKSDSAAKTADTSTKSEK